MLVITFYTIFIVEKNKQTKSGIETSLTDDEKEKYTIARIADESELLAKISKCFRIRLEHNEVKLK